MFKLLSLKLVNHPQLGNINVRFVDEDEVGNSQQPYSSVIIGPNGSGKSFILKTVADIFRGVHKFKISEGKERTLSYSFHIRYQIAENVFDVASRNIYSLGKRGIKQPWGYLLFRDRPVDTPIVRNFQINPKQYIIELQELRFPSKILVTSILLNDRFTFAKDDPNNLYQYLGVRRTNSVASTKSFQNRAIGAIFDGLENQRFLEDLAATLSFLGFDKKFSVTYKTRYHNTFFSGSFTSKTFVDFYINWKESGILKRKSEPWGTWYYKRLKRENPDHLEKLSSFLNKLTNEDFLVRPLWSRASHLEIKLFEKAFSIEELQMIRELDTLNILELVGIDVSKADVSLNVSQTSAGESHLLLSLITIYSRIQNSSLVLIDEPEISLHPNWQMQYINFLKRMFSEYSGSHFLIATHSPFIISDLEGPSSAVLTLEKKDDGSLETQLLEGINTYGWSVEAILYKVFEVRTTRNYYLEVDLRELLNLYAVESENYSEMRNLLERVKKVETVKNDPLAEIITIIENYLAQND